MPTSTYLAKLIGPVLLIMGAGMLADPRGYRIMAQEFLASRALIFIAGLLAFLPGLAIVLAHNVWVADWRLIITLFGWLALIGGTIRLVLPREVGALGNRLLAHPQSLLLGGVVVAALGAILSYVGYVR